MSESDFGENYYCYQSVYRKFRSALVATRALESYQRGFYDYLHRGYLKNFRRAARVLEVGCGYSGLIKYLRRDGFIYTGWDVSDYIVEEMHKIYPDLEFVRKDIQEAICDSEGFDLIICLQVLEHLSQPSVGLKNIFSLLKKEGLFLVTVPNPRSKIPLTDWRNDPTHVSVFTQAVWRGLLVQAGFLQVESQTFSTIPFLWRLIPQLSRPFFWSEFGASIFLSARKI